MSLGKHGQNAARGTLRNENLQVRGHILYNRLLLPVIFLSILGKINQDFHGGTNDGVLQFNWIERCPIFIDN